MAAAETKTVKNALYFYHLNKIGGVENFFYELVKKYKDRDICIYYYYGDQRQINRLKKYAKVQKITPKDKIKCKKLFMNYDTSIINQFDAEEYYVIIHADFKAQKLQIPKEHGKNIKYIGVSKLACESFKEVSGRDCELCYNPISIEKPIKKLHLVSATRLTPEKGRVRIVTLANELDNHNIPFEWDIFTNDTVPISNGHVHFREPTLQINEELAKADYVVQLSDCEGYCYTVIQALILGIPVIVCKWPVLEELGIDEKYGFILPFDMKNIPIEDIYNKEFNFIYTPPEDRWGEILD